jgi:hypothetical protein
MAYPEICLLATTYKRWAASDEVNGKKEKQNQRNTYIGIHT